MMETAIWVPFRRPFEFSGWRAGVAGEQLPPLAGFSSFRKSTLKFCRVYNLQRDDFNCGTAGAALTRESRAHEGKSPNSQQRTAHPEKSLLPLLPSG
jgi:hypothetical protein